MKKFIALLLILIYSITLFSQVPDDCCEEDSRRILNMFDKYKNKYIEVIKENLQSEFLKDSNIRMAYEKMGKIDLDSFEYRINPIMKWAKGARDYDNSKDNICNFFDIDTIFYSCYVALFKDSVMYFYCGIGNKRNILAPGSNLGTPELRFNFIVFFNINQEFHRSSGDSIISIPYNDLDKLFKKDYDLKFEVDACFGKNFIIKDTTIFMIPWGFEFKESNLYNECPQDYISKIYRDKWIQNDALFAPSYKIPWWQFWNWEIFH